ncbi:MAG: hypothetical protein ACREQ5_00605 [Candidatus Dormibacteria bacterium]
MVFEPLLDWSHPKVRQEQSPFSALWPQTRDLLLREADQLKATLVVVELELTRADLRQDGEIRAQSRLVSGKVRISLDTKHGPMRFACDRYLAGNFSWQANARAVALTMEALRTVERYGAVHTAEQYQGFLTIEAPRGGFTSADEALRWVQEKAGNDRCTPKAAYRAAVRELHPDVGGPPEDWERLDQARQWMEKAAML